MIYPMGNKCQVAPQLFLVCGYWTTFPDEDEDYLGAWELPEEGEDYSDYSPDGAGILE